MTGVGVAEAASVRVLVVDDHLLFAHALQEALDVDPGIHVVAVAQTIERAVGLLSTGDVDVVLLDYRLPDTRGISGITSVLAAAPGATVVLVTAVEDEQVLLSAIEAGCAGFVTKTADISELRAAVHKAAAGEALIAPAVLRRLLARIARLQTQRGKNLTAREREVLSLLVEGLTNADIAERLFLSVYTVRNHVQSILVKLDAHSKLEVAAMAVRDGLLEA